MLDAGHQGVERERPSCERGAVMAETLRSRARHGYPDRGMAGQLLGPGCRVDHYPLACARRADKDRSALRASNDLKRVGLLVAEPCADPLGELVASRCAR